MPKNVFFIVRKLLVNKITSIYFSQTKRKVCSILLAQTSEIKLLISDTCALTVERCSYIRLCAGLLANDISDIKRTVRIYQLIRHLENYAQLYCEMNMNMNWYINVIHNRSV